MSDFEFYMVCAAAVYVLVEGAKKVWPEYKQVSWLKRMMPVMPVILGVVGSMTYGAVAAPEGGILAEALRLAPYGIVGGALSSTVYEIVEKVIKRKADATD